MGKKQEKYSKLKAVKHNKTSGDGIAFVHI
jgi:hypothetical protein